MRIIDFAIVSAECGYMQRFHFYSIPSQPRSLSAWPHVVREEGRGGDAAALSDKPNRNSLTSELEFKIPSPKKKFHLRILWIFSPGTCITLMCL